MARFESRSPLSESALAGRGWLDRRVADRRAKSLYFTIQSVPLRRGSVACPIWAGGGVVTCATTLRRAAPPAAGMDQNGAGEGNRTLVISVEGGCSTIELHPHGPPAERCRPGRRPAVSAYCYLKPPPGGRGRTRTYEGVSQRIYSPPPLPLGTLSPDEGRPLLARKTTARLSGSAGFMVVPPREVNGAPRRARVCQSRAGGRYHGHDRQTSATRKAWAPQARGGASPRARPPVAGRLAGRPARRALRLAHREGGAGQSASARAATLDDGECLAPARGGERGPAGDATHRAPRGDRREARSRRRASRPSRRG